MSNVSAPAQSPRDEHKHRTRRALQDAALRLFSSQGFDATTTEEIAEQAGVSVRTFFRYFPTKESALFLGERDWMEAFEALYPTQPAELTECEAMSATLIQLAGQLAPARRSLSLFEQAVASSATLRGREQDHSRDDSERIAEAIATRRGAPDLDEACLLLGSVFMLTYRRALTAWLAGPADGDLVDVIAGEFRLLEEQLVRR